MIMLNISWDIRPHVIYAHCHDCNTKFAIEYVKLTSSFRHCSGLKVTRLPEEIYERWLVVKQGMKLTGQRWPSTNGNPPTAGEGHKSL